MSQKYWLMAAALMAAAGTVHAQCDAQRLTAEVPAAADWFGTSLALQGGVLAVGNPYSDPLGNDQQGSVRVFTNILGWQPQGTIVLPGGAANDWFGRSVGVSGDWLIAGMPSNNSGSGSVEFLQRTNGSWLPKTIIGTGAFQDSQHTGLSVAIDGNYAIAGVPDFDSTNVNAGFSVAFVRVGDQWQRAGYFVLQADAAQDNAGTAVGVRGDTFMMSVPGRDVPGHTNAGAIAITQADGLFWYESQMLVATDPQDGASLGRAAVLGDNIVVGGAPDYDNGIAVDSGAVYIFEPNQFGIWTQTARLLPPNPTPSAHFGGHVATDGARVVISEFGTGLVYVYRRASLGGWVEEWRLHDPSALGQGFGGDVAVSGDRVAVSSTLGDIQSATDAGYVHVFELGGSIGANAKAFAPVVAPGSYSGCTDFATDDGSTTCGSSNSSPDVWFRFVAPCSGDVAFNTFGSDFDTVLSLHASSISGPGATILCNDNAGPFFETSSVTLNMAAGQAVYIRIAGNNGAHGSYTLNIQACGPASCYANCDGSTTPPILNALDFGCFLTKFAAGDTYANCDNSTAAPTLNALDFGCYLTRFAAGCT